MKRSRTAVVTRLAVAVAAAAALAACGSGTSDEGSGTTTPASTASPTLSGTVNVFAAASLKETFTTLKEQFETANPGVTVTLNLGASSALATGINEGQPADVFASASQSTMDQVVKAGGAAASTPFAKNVMEIAVPPANPAGVDELKDLADPEVKVALCQEQVPCGKVAAEVFDNAGITVDPVSEEADVKAVLTKVQLGEVDAGVVYVTDVKASGDKVKGVEIPDDVNASTTYPIATLTKAANPDAAKAFMDYVLSPAGSSVLTAAGFAAP